MTTLPDGRSRYIVFSGSSAGAAETDNGRKAARSPIKTIRIRNGLFSMVNCLRLHEYFFEVEQE